MKKIIMTILAFCLAGTPSLAAPGGGPHGNHGGMHRPPMHGGVSMGHRPPMHRPPMGRPPMHHVGMRPPMHPPIYRPYRPMPIYRPYYYNSFYYPRTYYTYSYPVATYSYETVTPVVPEAETVVVRDSYAGINTAANVINAAANVAATIRYLTW